MLISYLPEILDRDRSMVASMPFPAELPAASCRPGERLFERDPDDSAVDLTFMSARSRHGKPRRATAQLVAD
jgi:hypothetical protein